MAAPPIYSGGAELTTPEAASCGTSPMAPPVPICHKGAEPNSLSSPSGSLGTPAAKFEAIPSAQADREARAAKAAEEAKAKEEAKAAKAEAKAAKAAALPSPSRKTRHTKDDAKDD